MKALRTVIVSLPLLLVPAAARATYSIVAADSVTGQVGGAVTSCVGSQGVGVVYRPSVSHGAVNAQAAANSNGRDRAVTLLNMDVAPADIITMITASSFDASAATRQYGVVDLMGRAAGFTGASAMTYKEDRQGTIGATVYSVQGNILTSKAVIDQAEAAFRTTGCDLADKLMLALEAGAMNGEGDSRCTPRGLPSDAASIEVDPTGATAGSFLKLAVAGTGSTSAVVRLREMFDSWRATHACGSSPGAGGAGGSSAAGGRGGNAGGGAGGRGGTSSGGSTAGAGGAAGGSATGGSASGGAGPQGGADAGGSGGAPSDGGGGCGCAFARSRAAGSSAALVIGAALLMRRRRHRSDSPA
jgi:uncharacterized Ntn-hydrolase superfamily protein